MLLLKAVLFACILGMVLSKADSSPKAASREDVLVEKDAKTKKRNDLTSDSNTDKDAAMNLKSTDGEREIEKQLALLTTKIEKQFAQHTSKMEKQTSKMEKQTSKIAELQRQLHKKEIDVDFFHQKIEKMEENEFVLNKKMEQIEKTMKLTSVKIRQHGEGSRSKKGVKSNTIDPLATWINQTDGKIKELETCCGIGYANPINLGTPRGTWNLIQHHKIGKTDAFKNNNKWADYKSQFGSPFLSDAAFWVGLDKMSELTSKGTWQLVAKVRYSNGGDANWGYVVFNNFVVEPEIEKFKMHFSGVAEKNNVGNSYWDYVLNTEYPYRWNGMKFSTSDNDNDNCPSCNCASGHGVGWWFDNCYTICLNCPSPNANIIESIMAIRKV